jgi:2-phosphosulfolactate phosphatase
MHGITVPNISVERRSTLAGAREAAGIVVVIDVLRAFTCAAMMFNYGISDLVLSATVEEALDLRRRDPNYLVAGEVDGRKVTGFDLGNSPAEIMEKGECYFRQRKVVLRSTSGTQGAVAVRHTATETIVAAYSTAAAVARYIKRKAAGDLVVTLLGMGMKAMEKSVEDERCGDYIEHLLTNTAYDHAAAVWDCLRDPVIAKSLRGERPYLPKEDVILALQRDLFDFAMVGKPAGNSVVVRPVWT